MPVQNRGIFYLKKTGDLSIFAPSIVVYANKPGVKLILYKIFHNFLIFFSFFLIS